MDETAKAKNITELAKLAGVSAGTVSRALTNSELISKKTRELVQALAREHGFRPNIMARNLRSRRSGAIGVLIPLGHETAQHISDPFFMSLLGCLADALTERGLDLLLSRVIPTDPDWLTKVVDSGRVDGVILIGQSDQSAVIDQVAKRFLPLVAWGANLPGQIHCSVGTDNFKGGELATRHLIERGAKRFAFLGDPIAPEIALRLQGARAALAAAGLSNVLEILPAHLTAETAHPAISQWLSEIDMVPDGIIAASDVIALSTLRALAERGHSVPKKVRVIGYDDLPLANQTIPPLTTVRQDLVAGAAHLVDLLFRRIGGEKTNSIVLEPQLIVRASS
jgi:DNA-binding LacI/PurR family transcriptional regulator